MTLIPVAWPQGRWSRSCLQQHSIKFHSQLQCQLEH